MSEIKPIPAGQNASTEQPKVQTIVGKIELSQIPADAQAPQIKQEAPKPVPRIPDTDYQRNRVRPDLKDRSVTIAVYRGNDTYVYDYAIVAGAVEMIYTNDWKMEFYPIGMFQ